MQTDEPNYNINLVKNNRKNIIFFQNSTLKNNDIKIEERSINHFKFSKNDPAPKTTLKMIYFEKKNSFNNYSSLNNNHNFIQEDKILKNHELSHFSKNPSFASFIKNDSFESYSSLNNSNSKNRTISLPRFQKVTKTYSMDQKKNTNINLVYDNKETKKKSHFYVKPQTKIRKLSEMENNKFGYNYFEFELPIISNNHKILNGGNKPFLH